MNIMGSCLSRERSNGETLDIAGISARGNVSTPLNKSAQNTSSEQRVPASPSPQNVSDKQRHRLDANAARTTQTGDKEIPAKECRNKLGFSEGEIVADKQQNSEDSLLDHPQASTSGERLVKFSEVILLRRLQQELTEKASNTPELRILVKELSAFDWAPLAAFLYTDDYHYSVFMQDVFDCIDRHRKRTEAELRELCSEWMKVGKLIDHLKKERDS